MSDLPQRPLVRILRAPDAALWTDGFAFLERAKAEATAILGAAEAEVAKAREEGRRAGEAEGAACLLRAHAEVGHYLDTVEPALAALALQIAERVIGTIGDAELVARAAREALKDLRGDGAVTVNVAPGLADEVRRRLDGLGPAGAEIRVAADRHLTGTRCTITMPAASLDIGIEAQFEAIRRAMSGPDPADV